MNSTTPIDNLKLSPWYYAVLAAKAVMQERITKMEEAGIASPAFYIARLAELEDLEQTRRLLDLPFPVLEALRAGMIGEEHAQLLAQIEDPDAQLEMIEIIYNDKLDVEKTRELVGRITQGEPSYVTADQSAHYHAPSCPFAQLIPEDRKLKFYTKQEVSSRGKVPCMQCL